MGGGRKEEGKCNLRERETQPLPSSYSCCSLSLAHVLKKLCLLRWSLRQTISRPHQHEGGVVFNSLLHHSPPLVSHTHTTDHQLLPLRRDPCGGGRGGGEGRERGREGENGGEREEGREIGSRERERER